MNIWPLQFRKLGDSEIIFTDDAGGYFKGSKDFLIRYIKSNLTESDQKFLTQHGHAFESLDDFRFTGFAARWAGRINPLGQLNYLILVPTLRCNLMCDYCQVSRAAESATGFDWDEEKTSQVLDLLDNLSTTSIKIEFQGGEPLLRLDILSKIREFCRHRFEECEFVVCTNLQDVSNDAWIFLDAKDTHVSTSFDGSLNHHKKRRTKTDRAHLEFERNLDKALTLLGTDRVSALPTIDPYDPPAPEALIEDYVTRGFSSIFLRRVNYQGFARKRFDFDGSLENWIDYYRKFIHKVISHNASSDIIVEEFYLSHLLRRIVGAKHHNHVDLRNPNWIGMDYIVIDFDGKIYPTDEARMVTRVGQIDLSIGSVCEGLNEKRRSLMNQEVSNFDDPDCTHCAYKAYCGLDIIDDLSRYGRVDLPRHKTDHCRSHLALFDFAFELIYSNSPVVQKSLSVWLGVENFSAFLARKVP